MAANAGDMSRSHSRPKRPQERFSLSKTLELVLDSISGDNSEVEDLSDNDEPVDDIDYHPPQKEPSSSEEESSGDEDPIPQASRGRKRL
ncbi:hypothetical protein R3I94_006617 [Phoxinus phoxinus]|uniref:Uncharacterized protein n=1 Tax=Phoxinus phoxinus TaxID=58324 RepID=A0AAN9DIH3_9TELE